MVPADDTEETRRTLLSQADRLRNAARLTEGVSVPDPVGFGQLCVARQVLEVLTVPHAKREGRVAAPLACGVEPTLVETADDGASQQQSDAKPSEMGHFLTLFR